MVHVRLFLLDEGARKHFRALSAFKKEPPFSQTFFVKEREWIL